MPELRLKEAGFTYSVRESFTKRERIQRLKETGDLMYIYKNEVDKACFSHDAPDLNSKNLYKKIFQKRFWKEVMELN